MNVVQGWPESTLRVSPLFVLDYPYYLPFESVLTYARKPCRTVYVASLALRLVGFLDSAYWSAQLRCMDLELTIVVARDS